MEFVFGTGFFLLAWILFRQQKELNKCRMDKVELTTRVIFLQKEVEFSRAKYLELSEFCEEQIDRADNAERKHKYSKRTIHVLRRRKHGLPGARVVRR